jgi:hypothetical protein
MGKDTSGSTGAAGGDVADRGEEDRIYSGEG